MVIFIIITIEYIILLSIIGIFVGTSSGLLGIGGGFIMVPLQYFLLVSYGIPADYALISSSATSLAVIIPTSLSSVYRHNKTINNIIIPGVKLGIFGILGAYIGAILAINLPTLIIKIIFSILLIIISINMFRDKQEQNKRFNIKLNLLNYILIGTAVGILSGLLGIGGGVFIVTILTSIIGLSLIESISISSVFISLTAIGGVSSYIINGINTKILPYSVGYINLINFITIIVFSIPFAYFGANISHKMPEKQLKKIFAIFMLVIAILMLL